MFERNGQAHVTERTSTDMKRSKLAMIIDPAEQDVPTSTRRVGQFLANGGEGLLLGGSGYIDPVIFQETTAVSAELASSRNVPLYILPGHFDQIPHSSEGITGVFNYRRIMGSRGKDFETVYPKAMQHYVSKTLHDRNIPDMRTLYVLGGDPRATVSTVSKILPYDLTQEPVREYVLDELYHALQEDINCVYLEAGSRSDHPIAREFVEAIHEVIFEASPETVLIVSGGIKTPQQAASFKHSSDFVVVGGHFEQTDAHDTNHFIKALREF